MSLAGGDHVPKETFHNLNDEKKLRIFEAAVHEFASHNFSEASINRIVKAAKIPWGSFYQYFNDKADIFTYVMDKIMVEIKTVEHKNLSGYADCDALTQFANKLASTIELNRTKTEYVRLAIVQSKENDPVVKKYYELQEERKLTVIKLFERDKQCGLIREDVDVSAVIDMVYLLSKETFYSIGSDGGAYLERMEAFLDIIREGIRRS